MIRSRQHQKGMTLLELMIATAIIGILASVAIPSFRNYQFTSKTTEAKANLGALAKTQKAYYSEFNTYVSVLQEPLATLTIPPGPQKRDSASVEAGFAAIGWRPEGDVYYDYDTHIPGDGMAGACACLPGTCFTATAYGDVDGDGNVAVIAYAQPDGTGAMCSPGIVLGFGNAPIRPNEPLHDPDTSRF